MTNLLVALSLAGLLLLKQTVFYLRGSHLPYHPYDQLSLCTLYLLLATFFYLTRRQKMVLFFAFLGSWNINFVYLARHLSLPVIFLYSCSLVGFTLFYVWKPDFFSYLAKRALLVSSPFFGLLFCSLLFKAFYSPVVPPLKKQEEGAKRVFVLLFDELDATVLSKVPLPYFDQLSQESFVATAAYPAGTDTAHSLPSMTTGVPIKNVGKKWRLNPRDQTPPFNWRDDNLFEDLKEINSAAVGGLICDFQRFFPLTHQKRPHEPFWSHCFEELRRLTFLLVPSFRSGVFSQMAKTNHIRSLKRSERALLHYAKDPTVSFCFAHLMGGHHPPIYDRKKERFSIFRTSFSYLDNLALVDQTLEKFEQALKESGLEEKTLVILTSDHWWRAHKWKAVHFPLVQEEWEEFVPFIDHRVPFVIKGFGSYTYDKPCSNLSLRALINALFADQIHSTDDLAAFFDNQTTPVETWPNLLY